MFRINTAIYWPYAPVMQMLKKTSPNHNYVSHAGRPAPHLNNELAFLL